MARSKSSKRRKNKWAESFQPASSVTSEASQRFDVPWESLLQELQKLNEAAPSPEVGKTVRELAELWNVSRDKVRQLLELARRSGVLCCTYVYRSRIDGVPGRVPAYWVERLPEK